jgi:hypothetical protein
MRHLSPRTETAYVGWIRRFILVTTSKRVVGVAVIYGVLTVPLGHLRFFRRRPGARRLLPQLAGPLRRQRPQLRRSGDK